jgi:predicted RNase H-like HicB family nuclease
MKSIQVAFYKEGSHWVAQALNVEVSSFGDTLDEAKSAIKEALELYFEDEAEPDVSEIEFVSVEQVNVQSA